LVSYLHRRRLGRAFSGARLPPSRAPAPPPLRPAGATEKRTEGRKK
jgi:hypothetical protein